MNESWYVFRHLVFVFLFELCTVLCRLRAVVLHVVVDPCFRRFRLPPRGDRFHPNRIPGWFAEREKTVIYIPTALL